MSYQPGYDAPQQPPPPPPVADRRAPERRTYERRAEDRTQFARTAVAAAMSISLGLAVLFLFFWGLGAIDVRDAVAATVVAVVLALVWVGGFLYRRREEASREVIRQDRERRGF
ncbi:MAG: hypothetical protein QOJ22_736 [Thermoleophilaceae bacterium]|jgi:fatty acid desaturase|nr:hypothetical protein [Thermoleophilaceae bacterium]